MIEINDKIVSYEVEKEEVQEIEAKPSPPKERPEKLRGYTYKIKSPNMEHSFYVTINDNPVGVPFEIFISSQDTQHYQWVAALTRMISAVFRRSEDSTFVAKELQAIVDPAGGLGFCKLVGMTKPRFIPSLAAAIGYVLEYHIGKSTKVSTKKEESQDNGYPPEAKVCKVCGEKAVILLDGCSTCLACSDSKCG